MSFNIIRSIDQITELNGGSTVVGNDKINALDLLRASIGLDLAQLNLIDVALGGGGGATSILAALTNIATSVGAFTPPLLTAGTYLPVGTGASNLSAVVPAVAHFMRIANIVHVAGQVSVTTIAGATPTTAFELSLPILPTNPFTLVTEITGVMNMIPTLGIPEYGLCFIADQTILYQFTAVAALSPISISYEFTYVLP